MNKRFVVIGICALLVGVVLGYYLGRSSLEREWSDPSRVVSQDDAARGASGGADPTPAAGTRVLRSMPIGRARVALAKITEHDPLRARVASVGRDDNDADLHVMLENRGDCPIVAFQGVAYAFNPEGEPEPFNKNGEPYVAFASKVPSSDESIAPHATIKIERHLGWSNRANVVLAQIDRVTCDGGKTWSRN